MIGHQEVHQRAYQPYSDDKEPDEDATDIRVGGFTAVSIVDSGSWSNFISADFCKKLKETPIPRLRGSTQYHSATGEKLVIQDTVVLEVF